MSEELPTRIAVVHDWLIDYSGAEHVLAEILRCLPQADLFVLVDHMPPAERAPLGGRCARTSFLQNWPGVARLRAWYLPLMPFAIEQFDLTGYDLVVSSSHAVAKGVIVSPDALHLSYVHTPMRYAWDRQFDYLRTERGPVGFALRWLLHCLRIWDHRSAAGVDAFIANSKYVARRILKSYRREAEVIHPPVDTEFFTPEGERGEHYVAVSRLFGYKRVDILVDAFARMPDRRLVVISDGPEWRSLKARAPSNVEFAGRLSDDEVRAQLRRARAFLFAAVEDFGIAPVEALACGTPVIALRRGGVAESVAGLEAAEPTGVFFEEQSADAVVAAVREFEKHASRIQAAACRRRAEQFSAARFRAQFKALLERRLARWREDFLGE